MMVRSIMIRWKRQIKSLISASDCESEGINIVNCERVNVQTTYGELGVSKIGRRYVYDVCILYI